MRPRTPLPSHILALGLAAALTACGARPAGPQTDSSIAQATSAPGATATAIPAATPTETLVPPTPTPTAIALSATDREDVLMAFKVMTLAELGAKVTLRSATMALAEADADPFSAAGRMLGGAMIAGLVKQEIVKITPPLTLQPFWDEMVAASDETIDLMAQWTDKKIKVSDIEDRMPAIVERVTTAVDNAQTTLIVLYAWDADELEALRQEMRDREDSFFATATPEP